MFRALQFQSNWYTPANLFEGSFGLFLYIKLFRLRPWVSDIYKVFWYYLRWCTYCRNNDLVSTIGTPRYGISKYPEGIIQPILNKNQHKVKSSKSFVSQVKTWKIELDEIQASYDVANLYPSLPVDDAMDVIILQSINDYDDLKTTKLVPIDILQLMELFIIECYFHRDNAIWNFLNLEPFGLSVMVVLSDSYLQKSRKTFYWFSFGIWYCTEKVLSICRWFTYPIWN